MKTLMILCLCAALCVCSAKSFYEYDLRSPAAVKDAAASGVALLKKGEELTDAYIQAIREEVCRLDPDFREYVKTRHEKQFGIVYQDKFCEGALTDGDI